MFAGGGRQIFFSIVAFAEVSMLSLILSLLIHKNKISDREVEEKSRWERKWKGSERGQWRMYVIKSCRVQYENVAVTHC